jgi:hypothetical protein
MSVGRDVLQLGRSLMIFVMRSVVIPCRHIYFKLSIWCDLECASFDSL